MPGIFVSYRRSDSQADTGRIYDRLAAGFGKETIFKDVDSIPVGADFRSHLNAVVSQCQAALVVVGTRWVDARDDAGARRLDDPDDFVRIEVEASLARGIPVIPVLVANATMPTEKQLPPSLAAFAYRQAAPVRPDPDFHRDMDRLVAALQALLAPPKPANDTLAEKLRNSQLSTVNSKLAGLPLDEALTIGIAIAGALDALHRQGHIHGALSPDHIVLTKTGVKLAPAGVGDGLQAVPKARGEAVPRGDGLKTVPYMAPEQLEGKEPDARSDIFAFGAVLYEMLTGKRAFDGVTATSVTAAVLHVEPPPVSQIQPRVPPRLDRVVRRCLGKDPDERWQGTRDLRDELKWIAAEGQSATAVPAGTRAGGTRRERLAWSGFAMALVAVAALAIPALRHASTPSVPLRLTHAAITLTPALPLSPTGIALSPDGQTLAHRPDNSL